MGGEPRGAIEREQGFGCARDDDDDGIPRIATRGENPASKPSGRMRMIAPDNEHHGVRTSRETQRIARKGPPPSSFTKRASKRVAS